MQWSLNMSVNAEVAQVVEHGTENAGVASSTLALGTVVTKGIVNIHIIVFSERKWLSGRASPCQGEGRGFESHLPLHFFICPQFYG